MFGVIYGDFNLTILAVFITERILNNQCCNLKNLYCNLQNPSNKGRSKEPQARLKISPRETRKFL